MAGSRFARLVWNRWMRECNFELGGMAAAAARARGRWLAGRLASAVRRGREERLAVVRFSVQMFFVLGLSVAAGMAQTAAVSQAPAVPRGGATAPGPVVTTEAQPAGTQSGVAHPGAVNPKEQAPNSTAQAPNGTAKAQSGETPSAITNPLPELPVTLWSRAGEKVEALQFEGVTFSSSNAIFGELQQKIGAPLNPELVRVDLRRLYATGRYRDIAVYVDAKAEGGGVTLVYTGAPRYYVGRVTIEGVKDDRLSSLLEFSTKLDPGTAYVDGAIPSAAAGVKESLAQNGFFEPKVSATTTLDKDNHQVNTVVTVQTGPQAKVGNVTVDGTDKGITTEEFREQAKLNCSRITQGFDKLIHRDCRDKVNRDTVSNALSGVRSYYQKKDHLEGTISLQKSTYAAERDQLDYEFAANQGPIVKVTVDGVKLARSRIKLLVPVFQEGAVDNDLLNEGAYNIKDYMQQKGYFDVQDSVKLEGKASGHVTVEYTVETGRRHKVVAVNIKGNKYFDYSTIDDLLRVKKGDAYQRSGRYSAQLVEQDVSSIESLYRANGFSSVKASAAVKDTDEVNGKALKAAQIAVTFTIVEGPQQKFGDVELNGVDASREKEIRSLLSSQTGQPFSLITLSGDRDAVLSYYLSHGFDHARVEIAQNVQAEDKTRTDVALNVTEGQQVFVDKVLLSGINHTRPSVVNSQLLVHAGDPLDQAALLQTQRNLYNLALFSEVNAAVQNPSGDDPSKNVLVQLTEAKRWDVTYGFGFEAQTGTPGVVPGTTRGSTAAQNGKAGVSPRVSIDVSRINLRGTQDSLTLHATYGLLEEVATLSFNVPQLLGHKNLTGQVSGGYSNVQNITTFASSTLQGDFRVSQKVKRADNFIYDFQYRRVSVDPNSLEITPNLIPQLSEPVTVGGPQITYFHDTRDPSPLDAHKGQYFSVQEFIASSKFGSDTTFNKLDVTESTYYTFGKKKYVFARNTRVGFEHFFGANPNASNVTAIGVSNASCAGTLLETNPTCNAVPLPERLYAGGATSHRGFGINAAGPRDLTTGYPVGGAGVVVNTFELRLPPPTLPIVGDSVSFVIFHDMGNVFQYPGDMFKSIKNFRQPNEATCRNVTVPAGQTADQAVGTCNFNYYSHAVGLGVRYNTPVGPIRLDFSYNLNPPIYPVFDDYSGAAPYVGQASHFNFFFSIGQSF
jgi:outer membrane protein insertion porin family